MEEYKITVTYIDNSDDHIKFNQLSRALAWIGRNAPNIADCLISHYWKEEEDRYFIKTPKTWYFSREDLIGEDAYYQEIMKRKEGK